MAVPTLTILAGSPPVAIELASVPCIRPQRHTQSHQPMCAPHASTVAHRRPASESDRLDRSHPTSESPNPLRNPHSARGTHRAPPTAISCLGAFRTPAASARGGIVIPGVQKPAHSTQAAVSRCSNMRGQSQTYSITSSARASSVGGTSRPRPFAVLRLMTISKIVGWITGRSAGFSPLRMRPA